MIHIYEKTCKTEFNQFGISEIINENPFKTGPCIITILAYPIFLKDINGSLRQVAENVNPDIDNIYNHNRRIFGLGFGDYNQQYGRFSRYSPSEEELNEFMIKYFFPLISEDNKKINVLKAMKNIRNITFVTYCNGAKVFKRIENQLEQKMLELGYTTNEIGLVLSQICLAAISGTVIKKSGTKALSISFGDIADIEFENSKKVFTQGDGFIQYNSSLGYGINGNGDHSFKVHMTENTLLSSKIKIFLNTSIDNAIYNQEKDIIDPITYEKIDNAFNSYNIEKIIANYVTYDETLEITSPKVLNRFIVPYVKR